MKLFFSEFKANYGKYFFPYQVWLLKQEGDDIEKIYDAGFLPIRNLPGVYYLSRSLRVNLPKFSPSSENRRILNKTASFEYEFLPLDEFDYTPEVQKFCKEYMDKRFGKGQIRAAGIKSIFEKGVYNYIFVWRKAQGKKEVGYAVCFLSDNLLQYAHAFYNLDLLEKSLGARMILEAVTWAQKNGRKYAYLGTCYEKNALYKTEFKGVEFFNGFCWSSNLEELKYLIERQSDEYILRDREFTEKFYQGDIKALLDKYGVRVKI